MKALHLCWSYPSEQFPFAGSFFRNMIEGLVAAGVDVTVVTPVPAIPPVVAGLKRDWAAKLTIPEKYEFNGVTVRAPRFFRAPYSLALGVTPYAMVHAVERLDCGVFDVVHGHFAYPFGFAANELARKWKIPSVITLHGSDVNRHPYTSAKNRRRFVASIRGAGEVFSVTDDMARQTEELAQRRPIHLPIGIDLKRFTPRLSKSEARRALGLPEDQKLILYVGALTQEKGIAELIEAARGLPESVTIVTVGDGALRPEIEACERMRACRPVANDRVVDYLTAADVFVLPSHSEGMPTVLVEAGAACLPVAGSSIPGIVELLAGERGVVFPLGDVRGLQEAILRLANNRELGRECAQRLFSHVCERHNASKNAQQILHTYERLRQ